MKEQDQKLKKGDKVVMHSCGEAEHLRGVIWTCKTDEYTTGEGAYRQDLIFLEGFSGSFMTDYLQIVYFDREEQLIEQLELKESEYQSALDKARTASKLAREYQAQVEQLTEEIQRIKGERV